MPLRSSLAVLFDTDSGDLTKLPPPQALEVLSQVDQLAKDMPQRRSKPSWSREGASSDVPWLGCSRYKYRFSPKDISLYTLLLNFFHIGV